MAKELIKSVGEIGRMVEAMRSLDALDVVTHIDGKLITVGYLCRASRFEKALQLHAAATEVVFFRAINTYTDIYSYVEKTLSLNRNVWWLLHDLRVRLIVTEIECARMNLSAVEEYSSESDLGIGFLRRADVRSTIDVPHFFYFPFVIEINFSLYAEHRDSILQDRVARTAPAFDPRQSDLF